MTAKIVHIRNIVAPDVGLRTLDVEPGVILTRAIADAEWKLAGSTFLMRRDALDRAVDWNNARYSEICVKRSEWDEWELLEDETAVLVTLPQDGGGNASQIAAIVAQLIVTIALIIYAPYLVPAWLTTQVGVQAATAITVATLTIASHFIISAVLPAPKQNQLQASTSPTYTLGAQSNQARMGAAVPEWFGLYNQVPDLRSQPWIDYSNNIENLYELFCLGKGFYQIQQMRIGTNVFAALDGGVLMSTGTYPEIEWQVADPGEAVTLFPDNVVTSSEVGGIELLGTNQPGYEQTAWFMACPPGVQTNKICCDMALPGGLYSTDSDGNLANARIDFQIWAQKIDDQGNTTGAPFTLLDEVLIMATNTPQRITFTRVLDNAARYQVYGIRTNAKSSSPSTADTIEWAALRAFLPSQRNYDCTMIAIKAFATQNLNGTSSDQFNTIAMRELITPVEVDGVWQWSATRQPTRSIAAAAYYLLSGANMADVDTSMIDGDWLLNYEPVWQGRGDTFDGGFDTQGSFWNQLTQVLLAGRAQALPGPLIGFVRDEPKTVYRCAFTDAQMAPDTFSINYIFFDNNSADAANVTYMDETTWTSQQVFCALPGSTLDSGTAPQVTAFGMVSRDQVYRTWMYTLAASCYRREFPTFDTELDGRVCFRGDLVKLSHNVPQWGAAARVVSLQMDGAGDILTLSEPWTLDRTSPVIEIATPDGYLAGPASVYVMDDGTVETGSGTHRAKLRLLASCTSDQGNFAGEEPREWPIWSFSTTDPRGLQRERPKCMMGTSETQSLDALIVSMVPQAGVKATVSAVVDNPAVYTADGGPVPMLPDPPPPDTYEDLQISNLGVREVPSPDGSWANVTVSVSGAPDATGFSYRTRFRDGGTWTTPSPTASSRTIAFRSMIGGVQVQVRAIGASSIGDWFERDLDTRLRMAVVNFPFDFSNTANSGNAAVVVLNQGVF